MFKPVRSLVAAAVLAAAIPSQAQSVGDLAFTAFNADEDGFAMVALVDLAAGTTVYFSDNEWDGSAFSSGESHSSWNTGAALVAAGTVIRFSMVDSATALAASIGSFQRETVSGSANWGLSQGEDTLYAYLGGSATAPTTFLSAVSTGTFGSATAGSLANTGLTVGSGAVQLRAGSDYAEYGGLRSGQMSFAGYRPLVSNVANWNDLGDGTFVAMVPDTTAFTVTPVPEPESWALMLSGLGVTGLLLNRRRRG